MGVFDTIRSILGLGGSSDGQKTELTVEAESGGGPDIDESAAAGTDATASTDSMTEPSSSDPETAAEPAEAGAGVTEHSGTETSAAESAEAAGPAPDEPEPEPEPEPTEDVEDESHHTEDTDADSDAAEEPSTEPDAADESRDTDPDGEPVETISGIGPAYAERLADAGIETVGQLRAADASELAEQTELSEKRIAGWQEQAS